eukprot:TRINITY_DN3873_c0_g1_i2.p1 TRINITY_DN3873_c0_g1~~TRINITY_DN3873_c0_g1_i2.p1  ORF type:complete len:107 (-),score=16.90 TRINITY_DN3873_c0_g1_i2:325-645(-)
MHLLYVCIILLCKYVISDNHMDAEKSRDVIIKVFHSQDIKFRCKFSIFLTKNGEVSLKLSRLACWPRNKRGNINSLELRGREDPMQQASPSTLPGSGGWIGSNPLV